MRNLLKYLISIFLLCFFAKFSQSQHNSPRTYLIKFHNYQSKLSKETKNILNEVVKAIRNTPDSNLKIIVSCNHTENEKQNLANWDRPNNIINYFVKRYRISGDKFVYSYGSEFDDCNVVKLQFTDEKISSGITPPHPNLRKRINN